MFDWVPFITYACITSITPGPNNVMSLSNASRYGLKKSLPFNGGVITGFATVMIVCTMFCNILSETIDTIKTPMLFLGAAYLLYLAWKTFNRSAEIQENEGSCKFKTGLFLQFVNVKIYIYCMVAMQGFVLPYFAGQTLPLLGFAILLAVIGSSMNILWACCGSIFKVLFSKYARITNTIMALALVYCAVKLFL